MLTLNRLCGSGAQSIVTAAQMIMLGEADVVVAGGMENLSQAPHVLRGMRGTYRLGRPPQAGTEIDKDMEDLEAADLDMVSDFFRRFYGPNNAVLTLAGDLPADALDRVNAWFGDLPAGPPVQRPTAEPVVLDGPVRQVMEDDVQLAKVYLAWHGPPYGTREWYAGDLLSVILTSGKPSILREDLIYRRRLAKDVSCQVLPTELCSTIALVATARPGVDPQALEDALLDHLSVVADGSIAERRVERARNQLLTYHYDELETLASRADSMSQFTTFFDDPAAAAQEPERYLDLGPEDLSRFVRERLRTDRMAVLWVVPEGQDSDEGSPS